jgi:Phosphotransferase enzyme family
MTSQDIKILEREPSGLISTFFNEIVTCRLADGGVRRLLLKRGAPDPDPTYGHRGGPPYEAEVYRRVLEPLCTSAPRLHAVDTDPATGETSLLIDYLADATTLKHSGLETLLHAARWIGTFHRLNESRVSGLRGAITEYDAAYYLGWVQRTLDFTRDLHLPWLPAVCSCYESVIGELTASPTTIIHGEYYPMNILVSGDMIAPVDWESAAIAAGEIDLSSLAEGWDDEEVNALMAEYQLARWPNGVPLGFERRLVIAGMYLMFRWLGDRPEWITGEEAERQFSNLRKLSERLEISL